LELEEVLAQIQCNVDVAKEKAKEDAKAHFQAVKVHNDEYKRRCMVPGQVDGCGGVSTRNFFGDCNWWN